MTKEQFKAQYINELTAVCANLGIAVDWLVTIIGVETANTYSPSITNGIGCVGLIQFCPSHGDVAVGSTTAQLKQMTVKQQLPYVQKYFEVQKQTFGMQWNSFADVYMTVFLPAYASKPDSFTVSQNIVNSNPYLFQNPNDKTLGTLRARMNSFCMYCDNKKASNSFLPNAAASISSISSPDFLGKLLGVTAILAAAYILYTLWKTKTY